MKNSKQIVVKGDKANKIKRFADAKAAKRETLKQMPIQDISKLNKVG